jgi:hypothetical protein
MLESVVSKDAVVGARRPVEMNRDTLYRSTVDVSETFKPVKGPVEVGSRSTRNPSPSSA